MGNSGFSNVKGTEWLDFYSDSRCYSQVNIKKFAVFDDITVITYSNFTYEKCMKMVSIFLRQKTIDQESNVRTWFSERQFRVSNLRTYQKMAIGLKQAASSSVKLKSITTSVMGNRAVCIISSKLGTSYSVFF